MKRVPPLLTILLVVMWLFLNNTVEAGQIVLGIVLAVALMYAATRLRPLQPRVRRLHLAVGLIAVVLVDIVRSNIGVARVVLGLVRDHKVHSEFLEIPLDLHDPHGLAMLAIIVTSTPGTVWVGVAPDGSTLTLHVLDLVDEAAWIHTIKHRYERPLIGIFQ